ncbi:hypothetical protein BFP97_05475 [Roseivirga sp. 4D4]|uniref:pyridoxamine 5'-phosphate oxidase family protein n=1 Tax=Roseivirga sp. 4D4 TaxID=1889784 RepID=UPI000852D8D9|nr:pyridoxamine 5'-phosphate oxidase family protein [Roseivirga sp. 4D4]OEK00993.1 hypothetical protein BFP97_05475 [Roseivirga sp. 4D4]
MQGILNDSQIDSLLRSELVGRLACSADGRPYVVPVVYAYDGDYIYSHTREGKKIQMLRENPQVCFEIDQVDDLANWRSVLLNGEFQELDDNGKASENAIRLLTNRMMPFKVGESSLPRFGMEKLPHMIGSSTNLVTYRIKITDRSGRFEKE